VSEKTFEMWGDGKQTRSFCYIDDCVEGILRIMRSDYTQPLNLGSDEWTTMNAMAKLAMSFSGKSLEIEHVPGPEGVRGRNSDNTLIRQVLGWAPSIRLSDGLRRTYDWIDGEVNKLGADEASKMARSTVVKQEDGMKQAEKRLAAVTSAQRGGGDA
jgi:GDP-D-mannose 3',5'-epimerase